MSLRARLYEACWPVNELARHKASPGLYERFDGEPAPSQPGHWNVPSFFCVKLKEPGHIFPFFQFYKRKSVVKQGSWRQM